MTTRGRQLAALIAIVIVFFLPKKTECSYPGEECGHAGAFKKQYCEHYEVEPLGFYGLELLFHRDLGFAYSSSSDCR